LILVTECTSTGTVAAAPSQKGGVILKKKKKNVKNFLYFDANAILPCIGF